MGTSYRRLWRDGAMRAVGTIGSWSTVFPPLDVLLCGAWRFFAGGGWCSQAAVF